MPERKKPARAAVETLTPPGDEPPPQRPQGTATGTRRPTFKRHYHLWNTSVYDCFWCQIIAGRSFNKVHLTEIEFKKNNNGNIGLIDRVKVGSSQHGG